MEAVLVEKDGERELPVPSAWRTAFKKLADNVVLGTEVHILGNIQIEPLEKEIKSIQRSNIDSYPDKLGPLHEQSWDTSIYIWNATYWTVLLDLSDTNGETTDLVFHSKVYETKNGFRIEPGLVYVP